MDDLDLLTDLVPDLRERVSGRIAALQRLLARIDGGEVPARPLALPPGPPPGKPDAPAKLVGAKAGRMAVKVAQALAVGPLRVDDIAAKVGADKGQVSSALNYNDHLFRKADPTNRLSPWELTEEGRATAT